MCEFNRIAFIAESKSTVCSKYSIALCRFNYQIFNSHTAVFDCFLRGAGNITEAPPVADEARRCFERAERLAKQDARARTRSSSGAFARECAEQLIESRKLSTAARRCGCRAGTARLLFFCRRFLFQIKRKCRNAGSIKYSIVVGREGRVHSLQIIHIVPLSRQRCVEVAAPYKRRINKIVIDSATNPNLSN